MPPLVFPYDMGPALQRFVPSLLYFGKILTRSPGWMNPEPVIENYIALQEATRTSHPELDRCFGIVRHYYGLALEHAKQYSELTSHLDGRIVTAMFPYPGDSAAYERDALSSGPVAGATLLWLNEHPEGWSVAAYEFIWHCHELVLELGTPRAAANALADECRISRGPDGLMLRSAIHRIASFGRTGLPLLTDCEGLLSGNGDAEIADPPWSEGEWTRHATDLLAHRLFCHFLFSRSPRLSLTNGETLSHLLRDDHGALAALRHRCKYESATLLAEAPGRNGVTPASIQEAIRRCTAEIGELLETPQIELRRLGEELLSDSTAWTLPFLALIAAYSGAPGSLESTTAAAVATCGAVGAAAFRVRRGARDELAGSDWRLIYSLGRG